MISRSSHIRLHFLPRHHCPPPLAEATMTGTGNASGNKTVPDPQGGKTQDGNMWPPSSSWACSLCRATDTYCTDMQMAATSTHHCCCHRRQHDTMSSLRPRAVSLKRWSRNHREIASASGGGQGLRQTLCTGSGPHQALV